MALRGYETTTNTNTNITITITITKLWKKGNLANGAMKIISFSDVNRDRVRCSDQPLYRSMIFLREAYWVTGRAWRAPICKTDVLR
ncbi:hypothetical protein M0802_002247 [Mischocyttarus mexicanus]|nr:hypothetical protein M0802_002247 [Mischocyttarus mexicanus]